MIEFLTMNFGRRRQLISQTAARKNLSDVAVEKDFWVCWTLDVPTVNPIRTSWEKAMLLHEECSRPLGTTRRKQYLSRHYYDIFRLIAPGSLALTSTR